MKAKHLLLFLAVGYALNFWASLRKITHSADADTLFVIATLCLIIGGLGLVYKIIRYPSFRKFMDS